MPLHRGWRYPMDDIVMLFGLLLLFIGLGALGGWIAFFGNRDLKRRVAKLEAEILALNPQKIERQNTEATSQDTLGTDPSISSQPPSSHISTEATVTPNRSEHWEKEPAETVSSPDITPTPKHTKPGLFSHFKQNWLTWIGGLCIGLSGVFLVKYSIENSVLGPRGRIILAVIFGISFHGLAYWLRRRTGEHSDAFAALAGGASIILYAAMLAALHLYQLVPPGAIFAALLTISIATMALALYYGPVLAAIGILGAYAVPILVNTGSQNLTAALIYSAIITLSALLLIRYVYRSWLWIGIIVGSLGWWAVGLLEEAPTSVTIVYLLVVTYFLIAIPHFNYTLMKRSTLETEHSLFQSLWMTREQFEWKLFIALTIISLLWGFTLATTSLNPLLISLLIAFPAMLIWLSHFQPQYSPLVLFSFGIITIVTVSMRFLGEGDLPNDVLINRHISFNTDNNTIGLWLAACAAVFTIGAYWNLKYSAFKGFWSSISCLALPTCLALAYFRLGEQTLNWQWSIAALLLATVYIKRAFDLHHQPTSKLTQVSLIIAAHFAYSLAAVIYFSNAHLTLALAVQIVSLTHLFNRFSLPILHWAIKGLISLIIVRLTFNPWMADYATTAHWPLWIFGGPLLCCLVATQLAAKQSAIQQWLQGASLHLFMLTLFAETRYLLYNGDVFTKQFTLTEAALDTAIWGGLGLVYYFRSRVAGRCEKIYKIASALLLSASLLSYILGSLLLKNPLWENIFNRNVSETISNTPILNILLLAYGAPIAITAGAYYLLRSQRKLLLPLMCITTFIFINMEIRHLWKGSHLSLEYDVTSGELYTYSMVWLFIAIIGVVTAIRWNLHTAYRGAMILLMGVIAKIFFIDMSGLSGLLRVSSFMGLGLCLLGLAYLHQRAGKTLGSDQSFNEYK